ncbi:hypothetical protein F4804DRAFT_334861 [Jackrogersella minutella]|nr:hypothetical protein F4804DRAFT_334861 [Jackrogersella minutella]
MPSNDSPSLSRMPSKSRNSFKRQNTTDSNQSTARINTLKRPKSFKSQAEQKAVKPKKHQEKVAAYWPLTWDLLLGFLLKKWPNEAFEGQKSGDYWVFEVPQLLTEVSPVTPYP